jgi:predicted nucleotidyltransferase
MFEQDRVLVRLRQQIARDRDIKVCFLTGSYGRGTQDEYSDLDLVLVYRDKNDLLKAFERRSEFASSILPFVPVQSYDADHIRPFLHSALFGNGARVDFQYAAMTEMGPESYFRKILLLKDTDDGWGRNLQISSERSSIITKDATISARELSELNETFWVLFMEVYRQVQRGDQYGPFTTYIHLLNMMIPKILNLLPADDPSYQILAQSIYDEDTTKTLQFLRLLLRSYLEARATIVDQYNLEFRLDSPFERELKKIILAE